MSTHQRSILAKRVLKPHLSFASVINSFVRNGVLLTTPAAIKSLRSADRVSSPYYGTERVVFELQMFDLLLTLNGKFVY